MTEEQYQRQELLQIYQRRLGHLEQQAANFGFFVPTHIALEIDDLRHKIAQIEVDLGIITPPVDLKTLRQLELSAWEAYHRPALELAVDLLAKLVAAKPDDRRPHDALVDAQRRLDLQDLYRLMCKFREQYNWQAMLDVLEDLKGRLLTYTNKPYASIKYVWEDLERCQSGHPSPDQLLHWAAEHQRRVRIIGVVTAGQPLPDPEDTSTIEVETIEVPFEIAPVEKLKDVYALRVKGRSMIDALVDDGDIVFVRYQQIVQNGQMAVVYIEGENSVTLKYFYHEDNLVRLQPANINMEPIYIDAASVHVQAVYIGVLRQVKKL